jgi:hypothetical protein
MGSDPGPPQHVKRAAALCQYRPSLDSVSCQAAVPTNDRHVVEASIVATPGLPGPTGLTAWG